MPHFICRWPGGDVLLASVDSRQELDTILQERCEPGVCKVARYHGPLVLELKPDLPGLSQTSAERFKPAPACPSFQPAWPGRSASGDVLLVAADGSQECAHKLVLQCRMPVLEGQVIPRHTQQVRLSCVPDAQVLQSLVQFLYLDTVEQQARLSPELHCAALACGLERLVDLCEARFAQHLELQLTSWPGLGPDGQGHVLDSFIGWTLYCDRLGRQQLKQLCVHALARHVSAAQSRACWPSLGVATCSLVQLVAASTAPPLIHRQLLPDGSAITPANTNPGASGAAAGSVVSVDAEAFAAAGGRLTSSEWQQLQKFRSAVAESRELCEASPLVLDQQHMASCSLTSPACSPPHVSFSVKSPVLGPHKRLMDSVCRFAFPATHTLLTNGWQLKAAPGADAGSGADAAVAEAAADVTAVPFGAPDLAILRAAESSGQLEAAAAATAAAGQPVSAAAATAAADGGAGAAAAVCEESAAAEHSSSSTQQPAGLQHVRSLLGASSGGGVGDVGSATAPAAGSARQAAQQAGLGVRTRRSGRLLSASSAGGSPSTRRSSHGRSSSSLRPAAEQLLQRSPWGSGLQPASPEEQPALSGAEQQQPLLQAVAGLPLPLQRLLQAEEQSGSWGSGTVSRQPSSPLQPGYDGTALSADAVRTQQELLQQQLAMHASLAQVAQAELRTRLTSAQQLQQNDSSEMSEVETMDDMGAVFAGLIQQQQQHMAAGFELAGGSQEQQPGIMELPAFRALGAGSPAGLEAAAEVAEPLAATATAASASGLPASPLAVLQRSLVEDFVLYEEASAARQHVVGILVAVEQGDAAAGQRLMAPSCTELIAATAPAAVVNRLAAFLPNGAAAAPAAGGDATAASALQAAAKYLASTRGISKLLGMASSSRAALEPSHAQQQQQHSRLLRTLQHISAMLPELARLLSGHPLAAAAPPAAPFSAPLNGGSIGRAGVGMLLQEAQQQQQQRAAAAAGRPGARPVSGASWQGAAAAEQAPAATDSESYDLGQALAELLQLPELLQGAPVLLTQEQYQQREQQLQQLAWQAAAALQGSVAAAPASPPGPGAAAGADAGRRTAAPSDAAGVGGSPHAAAITPAAGGAGRAARGLHRVSQTGALFSSILSALGAAVAGPGAPGGGSGGGAAPAVGQLSALLGGGGLLDSQAAADGRAAAAGGAARGAGGVFSPTGVGALLSGGLLAEGGVAGDSIFDDMAADVLLHGAASVRRITCHGLYELCAALASTADAQTSPAAATGPPAAAEATAGNNEPNESGGGSSFAGSVGVGADAGRLGVGQQVSTGALGTASNSSRRASASAAGESEQQTSSIAVLLGAAATAAAAGHAPQQQQALAGQKRRLSDTAEQQERQLARR